MVDSKRETAFYNYLEAVQTALDTVPEAVKEEIEDKASAYFETLDNEGFAYEESWEYPEFNASDLDNEGFAQNEPLEGLAFLTNAPPQTKRMVEALTSVGEALRDFVQAEESPETETALQANVEENAEAMKRAGFAIFKPEGKGFKEIK